MKRTLKIDGMSCQHCIRAVRTALEELDGLSVGDVRLGEAEIEFDPTLVDESQIEAAVEEEGYVIRKKP